ncbi:hypothetical protein [Mesorhizobium sp. M2A.F.Ca.ET.039.01.1.1]|uniref:hypothetical protein n=1 Tax=Mesorhizobium sp. M2A.F.Ca.ET.039.01.1.1 TaxID=2496746 RepID=UPI00167BC15F|nr:hypothetical protein [Mesorhizobium sp. M2A.F.Ca.ET.039.01.1.1]
MKAPAQSSRMKESIKACSHELIAQLAACRRKIKDGNKKAGMQPPLTIQVNEVPTRVLVLSNCRKKAD